MKIPRCQILKDHSKKNATHRFVYKVVYDEPGPSTSIYKCYQLRLSLQNCVHNEILLLRDQIEFNRWIEITEWRHFPTIYDVPQRHTTKCSAIEYDLLYFLHSCKFFENHPTLQRYIYQYNHIKIYFARDQIFILQPWVEAQTLTEMLRDVEHSNEELVDTIFEMFDAFHGLNIALLDVTLPYGRHKNGSFRQNGNIWLKITDGTIKPYIIDIESLVQMPTTRFSGDISKVNGLTPPSYFMEYWARSKGPYYNPLKSLTHSKPKQFGWVVDYYILFMILAEAQLLSYSQLTHCIEALDLVDPPKKASTSYRFASNKSAPLNLRLSRQKTVEPKTTRSTEPQPPKKSTPNVERQRTPIEKSLARIWTQRTRLILLGGILIGVLLSGILTGIDIWNTVSPWQSIEPFHTVSVNKDNIVSTLNTVEKELAANTDKTRNQIWKYYIQSQYPPSKGSDNVDCPIRALYANPKKMYKHFDIGRCNNIHTTLKRLRSQEHDKKTTIELEFIYGIYALGSCISQIGHGNDYTKLCTEALSNSDTVIHEAQIPNWAQAELFLYEMAILNTKKDLQQSIDIKKTCQIAAVQYSASTSLKGLYKTHLEFGLNRCFLLLVEATDIVELGETLQNPDNTWSTKQWFKILTMNGSKGVGQIPQSPDQWTSSSKKSYYSWIAYTFAHNKIYPLPDQLRLSLKCRAKNRVAQAVGGPDTKYTDDCIPSKDSFGWINMIEAFEAAGFSTK